MYSSDLPLSSHLDQLLHGNPKAFPGWPRSIVSPTCPGSSCGSPAGGVGPEHHTLGGVAEASQHLNWLLARRSSSSSLSRFQMTESRPISRGESRHPVEETNFGCLYRRSRSSNLLLITLKNKVLISL